jgi:hypothetical protein
MPRYLDSFEEIILCDFEYHDSKNGNRLVIPVCACAKELRSGREFRLWEQELIRPAPPWVHGPNVLFCSYNAPAELGCFLELKWPLPQWILDLCIEHRQVVNGVLDKKMPRNLLAAMRYYGLPSIDMLAKQHWQNRIILGGPFDAEERRGILEYCWSDVRALELLLQIMIPNMPRDLERALFRGRYTLPITETMHTGIPVDTDAWEGLYKRRADIQHEVAARCEIYDGTTFKMDRFGQWLVDHKLLEVWPRTPSGRLSTSDDTLREFALFPDVENVRQIRQVIDHLRKPSFQVKAGRNYFNILPFKAETSRNSTIGCLFQAPRWLRGLIQPKPGIALAYIDYEQEEFFIAGVRSADEAMLKAYASGDAYISFGIESGLIPPGGSKVTHPIERDAAKTITLALLYGMKSQTLAARLGVSRQRAEDLLDAHHRMFRTCCAWSDEQVRSAYWHNAVETFYGWKLAVNPHTKERTLRNFRVQGDGAEILRLANIFLWEKGVRVCAPVHDAVLVECPESEVEDVVRETRRQMERASECVLEGHRLRTDARLLFYPDRLLERHRGQKMWDRIMAILDRLEGRTVGARSTGKGYR